MYTSSDVYLSPSTKIGGDELAEVPNYHVKHVDRYEADISINPWVEKCLTGNDLSARETARKIVCRDFNAACAKQYGDAWRRHHRFVTWNQITITPLNRKKEDMALQPLIRTGECCDGDSCQACPDNHSKCTATVRCTVRFVIPSH